MDLMKQNTTLWTQMRKSTNSVRLVKLHAEASELEAELRRIQRDREAAKNAY
jgi:hypothetical protein